MNLTPWDYRDPYEWIDRVNNETFPPLMINCSITGELSGKECNINIPETMEEQIEAVYAAYQEGAVIAHIHARDPKNQTLATKDKNVYSKINEEIRKKCPGIIINNTTGGGPEHTIEEKRACLFAECKPDMASLNTGIFQINMTLKERREPLPFPKPEKQFDENIVITHSDIHETAKIMLEYGIKPEIEIFHSGNFMVVRDLIKSNELVAPYVFDMIFGLQSSNYATPEKFIDMIRELPSNAIFFATGMGHFQLPMNVMSILTGGHVRVGMEDTYMYRKGELAKGNAQYVARIRRIAEDMNRPIASCEQARNLLNL